MLDLIPAEAAVILEVGCGEGTFAGNLKAVRAEAGSPVEVWGVEMAEAAAAMAANHLDRVLQGDVGSVLADLPAGHFDCLVLNVVIEHVPDPGGMLRSLRPLLKPGGCVLLDVYSLNTFNQKEESATYELNQLSGFWSPKDYFCFVNTFKYEKEKVILDKYTIIEASRKRVVYNWLQCYSKDSIRSEFEENGFKADELYSDVAGQTFTSESSEIAVVAKKS